MEGQSSNSPSQHQFLETKLTKMLQNVEPPKMNEHGRESIYRVPQSLRETNPKAYTPRIISIGPFHKARDVGKEDNILESMEELKLKYLKGFLNRTQLPMRQFVDELKRLEESIRSCYAVPIKFNSDDFLETILIDACFIIELFLRWNGYRDWEGAVHLLPKQWILADIRHDLILLENQLPFFVLEELYNLTGMNHKFPSLLEITFNYFKIEGLVTVRPTECPKHFTDLLRTSIISSSKLDHGVPEQPDQINHLYSASQLLEAGLKFKVSTPNESLVDLTYSDQASSGYAYKVSARVEQADVDRPSRSSSETKKITLGKPREWTAHGMQEDEANFKSIYFGKVTFWHGSLGSDDPRLATPIEYDLHLSMPIHSVNQDDNSSDGDSGKDSPSESYHIGPGSTPPNQ
ncbi:UPF0481 protein [Spatholobus suberectus]|nr:UPF0481 protein [Spatholobus suberectus]